jgi:hypothetical protein
MAEERSAGGGSADGTDDPQARVMIVIAITAYWMDFIVILREGHI